MIYCSVTIADVMINISKLLHMTYACTEEGILRDTEHTELAIRTVDPNGIVLNTSSIARRANRVLQVAQQEVDNSEDPRFVDHVNATIRELRASK